MFAFLSNMRKNFIRIMDPFWLMSIFPMDFKVSINFWWFNNNSKHTEFKLDTREKNSRKKWTTKLDKSDKQWKQMTLVTSKWMSIKVQLMFEKEMGVHAKKNPISMRNKVYLMEKWRKSRQRSIDCLPTYTHTQHCCSKIKWIEIIYIYDAFKRQFNDTNSAIPGTF